MSKIAFFILLFAATIGHSQTAKVKIPNINTDKFTEFAPSISADGKTMVFESDRNKGWKLFQTKLDSTGNWSTPVPIDKINDYGSKRDLIGGPNLSYDGNFLYFFGFFLASSESEDLYVSNRVLNGWSEPIKLDNPVNTEYYEGFPSLSSDDKTLYFVRLNEESPTTPGTEEPCLVIYKSIKNADDTWSEPEKLPAPINLGCAHSPKIMADGRTLVFSSVREGGKGLFDMYQSTLKSDGSWTEPINLEFINTEGDDLSPTIPASGSVMYFVSNGDIYQTEIPKRYRQSNNLSLDGFVVDAKTDGPISAKVELLNKESDEVILELESNESDGWYNMVLTGGTDYEVQFLADGYIPYVIDFDLKTLDEYKEDKQNVKLVDNLPIKYKVVDSELGTPILANVKVKEGNSEVLNKEGVFEFSQNFAIDKKYNIEVAHPQFNPGNEVIEISHENYKYPSEVNFKLEPKKISVQLAVNNLSNNSKVRTKLLLKNKDREETLEAYSDEQVALRVGDRYLVATDADGFMYSTQEFVVDEEFIKKVKAGQSPIELNITPVELNAKIVLKELTFDFNSAEVRKESKDELDRAKNLILDNPGIIVELAAHTDNVGNDDYNLNLSQKRAESVKSYLVNIGVPENRLQSKGYGMTQPAFPNDTEENQAKNRRVELVIVGIK